MDAVVDLPRLTPLTRRPGVVICRSADGREYVRILARGSGAPGTVGPTTRMYAASLAKQVIGILVAQQCASGVLSPRDPVHELLPQWPSWAHDVTVSHLLHHTSGLPPLDHRAARWSNTDVLAALRGSPGMVSEPGSGFAYSNIGYICLAEIVALVSRIPVHAVAYGLFDVLGMSSSTLDDRERAIPHHTTPPRTVGDGGFWTSAEDLLRWNDAMNSRVLGESIHRYAETPGRLNDGSLLDYAWGVRVLGTDRRRIISHGGAWPTWTAKSVRRPDAGTSVVLLSASDETDATTDLCLTLLDRLG